MNEKQKILSMYLNDELTNLEIIELLVAEREENETLRSANEDLIKENRTLKNFKNIDVKHPDNKFF